MPYLIDGHNLIAHTPGLSLDDPHDELKLVRLVRRHCLRERRKATIIFDRGLPGGRSDLSSSDLTVIFASDRYTTADDLILRRIQAEKNPAGLIVITSDRRIAEAARRRGIPVQPSAGFARQLTPTAGDSAAPSPKQRGLSPTEAGEWEAWFRARKRR